MPKPIKRNKEVRQKTWAHDNWDTHSRQSRTKREDSAPVDTRKPEEYFTDVAANAIVISPYGVLAFVHINGEEQLCRVDATLCDGKASVLAPGDHVQVDTDAEGLVIRAVRPRSGKLSRPTIATAREQVLAANIDHAVIVASVAKPAFKPGLIDRYLVAAQAGGVSPIICVNKSDLLDGDPEDLRLYTDLGVTIVRTSCKTGEGLDALRALLENKTSVLTGHSGVGKSSLANALDPNLDIATQEISESNSKGRHTTTASRLYELAGGIRIIDTPGIKQLGLWGVSAEELDYYFHEFAELAGQCKFRDCTHTHEPKCAVLAAIEAGTIARARYDSYVRIRTSLTEPQKQP